MMIHYKMRIKKWEAIKKFPTLTKLKDARALITVWSYYRKFIENFAFLAKPLTRLTKNDVGFQWGNEEQAAFETFKAALIHLPVLAHYNPDLVIEIRTDASGFGLGAVIVQKYPEGWKPIAYASRQLTEFEKNYSVSEL